MKLLFLLAAVIGIASPAAASDDALTICLDVPAQCLSALDTRVLPQVSGKEKVIVELDVASAFAALDETKEARILTEDADALLNTLLATDTEIDLQLRDLALAWWAIDDVAKARNTLQIAVDHAGKEKRPDLQAFALLNIAVAAIEIQETDLAAEMEAAALGLLPVIGADPSFSLMPYPELLAMTGRHEKARDVARVMSNPAIAAFSFSDVLHVAMIQSDLPAAQAAASELKGLCLGEWWHDIDFDPIIASLAIAGYQEAAIDCLNGAAFPTIRMETVDNPNGEIDEQLFYYVLALDAIGRYADRDRIFLRIHNESWATRAVAKLILRRHGGS